MKLNNLLKSAIDWSDVDAALDQKGFATTPVLLSPGECRSLQAFYGDPEIEFRSRIDMARYNYGQGEYKYFAYPLPVEVQTLREFFYPPLARIANAWHDRLGIDRRWPETLAELLQQCHTAGQRRPTPLMLKYGATDFNCLHQDLYGEIHFPLQLILQLSAPGEDFDGGELVLVEQRPRLQSRAMVVPLRQGQAVIIPVKERPRLGKRGYHRAPMRHGVSEIRRGQRLTLGIIFHDAA